MEEAFLRNKVSGSKCILLTYEDFKNKQKESISIDCKPDEIANEETFKAKLVDSPAALVQAIGYLQYKMETPVLLRGQSKMYKHLMPSLFRTSSDHQRLRRYNRLQEAINEIMKQNVVLSAVSNADLIEVTLQHYGMKTTWLDAVDNIWIALWFAVHEARAKYFGKSNSNGHYFSHYQIRSPQRNEEDYAFIVILGDQSGNNRVRHIDLRKELPSQFIRPHAQHAHALQVLNNKLNPKKYYDELKLGTIAIRLEDAINWLGTSHTLTTSSLFPNPLYDSGFGELLTNLNLFEIFGQQEISPPRQELFGALSIYTS